MKHSKIVGGSTAKRVMNCPGSVALCAKMPPQAENQYMAQGTMLHDAMAHILGSDNMRPQDAIKGELLDEKIRPALDLLNEVDPDQTMEYEVETEVSFGDFLPGVFGSTDLVGRIGQRAIVLDWKFGDGVMVDAKENEQLMFYAAAAMRTAETAWAFSGVDEVELVIIQPPAIRRWVTTPARIKQFELDLKAAVKASQSPDAALKLGDHCRWCTAKPVCPQMTGAVDRARDVAVKSLNADTIGAYLTNADILEGWITDLRALAFDMLKGGRPVPGWKLVPKRGIRSWANEDVAKAHLMGRLKESEVMVTKIVSPAQAEKLLKSKVPESLTVSISSGSTIASESDPRPAVMLIGQQLTAALSKLV